ncbi:MAG: hypothetical protein M1822_008795 [Bathelium mastoideum]|nr:MAG: hypothetical protein M1822_008795 [Bathelium mastoideum]
MRLKEPDNPNFDVKKMGLLWKSEISDLRALKSIIPGSTLVSLDIESSTQGVSEIGLAFLHVNGQVPHFYPGDGTKSFYAQNKIQAHTVQVRDRLPKSKMKVARHFGDVLLVNAEEVALTLRRMLSDRTDKLILVGFDFYNEFKWISQECSFLSTIFTAWVDVQEIAFKQSDRSGDLRFSLSDTIRALEIKDWYGDRHRASHDAVRCLAALSGIIKLDRFTVPSRVAEVKLHSKLPPPNHSHPFTARVTTTEGCKLPPEFQTSRMLSKHFEEYDLEAVALNRPGFLKANGVGVWWLSFSNLDSLKRFVADIHGSTLSGKRLTVDASIRCRKQEHVFLLTPNSHEKGLKINKIARRDI